MALSKDRSCAQDSENEVTAQLIRAHAGQHLRAETCDRDFGDALQLQRKGVESEQVRPQSTPEIKAQFDTPRSVNPEAYDSYLRGRYHIYKLVVH